MSIDNEIERVSGLEIPSSAFCVEMAYDPDLLYKYISSNREDRSIDLKNNWESIARPGFPLISSVWGSLDFCDRANYDAGWPNREAQLIWLGGGVYIWGTLLDFPENLEDEHKLLNYKPLRKAFIRQFDPNAKFKNPNIDPKEEGDCEFIYISTQVPGVQARVKFAPGTHNGFVIDVAYPWTKNAAGQTVLSETPIMLNGPEDVGKILDCFIKALDVAIKTEYAVAGKELPSKILEFAPFAEEETRIFLPNTWATCTFCNSKYSVTNGPTCPRCGGSQPSFK